MMWQTTRFLIFILTLLLPINPALAASGKSVSRLIGPEDSVLVTDPAGKRVVSIHAQKLRVPASTLKILTALAALHFLGPDYRYTTEFFLDARDRLKVKGYGDPLLISENMAEIAHAVSAKIKRVNGIVLDDAYFSHPLAIPGVSRSLNPYDATNGALCVNFNTVNFKRGAGGEFISAEAQTPLLPMAVKKIKASGLREGRIVFSQDRRENILYTGHLLAYFLEQQGVVIEGDIGLGAVDRENDRPILRFRSPNDLANVVSGLLTYSNNYIANQILLTIGAVQQGPPATLQKGVDTVLEFARSGLGISDIRLAEGSGISRKNRISAASLIRVLESFESHRHLMKTGGDGEFYKTGSLSGIRTRAGYIEGKNGGVYRFVVLLNTSGKSTEPVMKAIRQMID